MMDLRPKLVAASQRLQEPINQCDVIADMDSVRRKVEIVLFCQKWNRILHFYIILKRCSSEIFNGITPISMTLIFLVSISLIQNFSFV